MPEQSLLDKPLEQIGEIIDKPGKTYKKLIDGEDQDTGRVAPKCLQNTSCEKC